MTRWIVCVTKHPTHTDPHKRIQSIGTTQVEGSSIPTRQWTVDEMIAAIDSGDEFYCDDANGDLVLVVVAQHNANRYVKTEPDGIQPNNLLAKDDCD